MKTYSKIKLPRVSPSPAATFVVALLALVAALSMPAQAAMERLAKGSVGTAQLKDGAVTTPKLRYGAVTSAKIRNGSVTVADLSVQARPRLPRSISAKHDSWTTLNSDGVQMARLDLPAGRWLVLAKGLAQGPDDVNAICDLDRGSLALDTTIAGSEAGWAGDSLSLLAPMVAGGERVTVSCWGNKEAAVGLFVLSAVEVR